MSNNKITIEAIISQLKTLYKIDVSITFDLPDYTNFHNNLTNFIYENNLENTEEWQQISNNLVYRSNQRMIAKEADVILIQLELLKRKLLSRENESFWEHIHPLIKQLISKKFYGKHYADCVETAFKEINSRLKKIYRQERNEEKDGSSLMNAIFSPNNPLLKFEDITTETGRNVQNGYMQIFAGAMTGIRNPKAHDNQTITKDAAIKRLIFASLLMDKIDEAIRYSNINEV